MLTVRFELIYRYFNILFNTDLFESNDTHTFTYFLCF
jgi:hypothetical protein